MNNKQKVGDILSNKGTLSTHNQYTPGPSYDSRLIQHGYTENVAGVFAKNPGQLAAPNNARNLASNSRASEILMYAPSAGAPAGQNLLSLD